MFATSEATRGKERVCYIRRNSRQRACLLHQEKLEAESVFGHIKGNRLFCTFSLRGWDKVHVQFGLVALAHNLLK
uniref:transposase n=1 Tax=Paenibacillus ihumii TaxID=687436 RepID=UPI0021CBFFE6|nr:transposase [Paenibacillus ihumii]